MSWSRQALARVVSIVCPDSRARAAVLALLASATPLAAAPQDPPTPAQIDQWIEHAQGGRPAVRPQAAQRLVRAGAPAAARLLDLSAAADGTAKLGPDLVEILGAFGSTPLRAKLLEALRDLDFPWRPAAARGLAAHPVEEDRALLLTLLEDPLAAVRAAALDGLRALGGEGELSALRARLADEDDRVRRRAAALLADRGERQALAWLLEDLGRSDSFFDRSTGASARYEAWTFLKPRLGEAAAKIAFQPQWAPLDAQAAEARGSIAKLLALPSESPVELPALARATNPAIDEVLGLELRSCRKGELFLRWNARDELWVGLGAAARLELAPGTSAQLFQAAETAFTTLGAERFFGAPGCDLEDYLYRPPGAKRAEVFRLSKGPEAVPGLRPPALGELARRLLAALPEDALGRDRRTVDLARRVRETLSALGGPLSN